jgi:hypothetical protein
MERYMSMFARDIIEAAKSDLYFDKENAKEIADHHGQTYDWVLKEIKFVRKHLSKIEPDWCIAQTMHHKTKG